MSSENNQENQESRRPVRRIQTQRSIVSNSETDSILLQDDPMGYDGF